MSDRASLSGNFFLKPQRHRGAEIIAMSIKNSEPPLKTQTPAPPPTCSKSHRAPLLLHQENGKHTREVLRQPRSFESELCSQWNRNMQCIVINNRHFPDVIFPLLKFKEPHTFQESEIIMHIRLLAL